MNCDGLAAADLMDTRYAEFVLAQTTRAPAGLATEITLHLATHAQRIFQAAENFERPEQDRFPPYWAFAWPGGQAMARYILENPDVVAGLRVIDVGSGSGIAAIAAAMAGATRVLAADIDPVAAAAIRLNAAVNGCGQTIETTTRDRLGSVPEADLVIMSDLVYEPELAIRVDRFLDMATAAGKPVLIGDRLTARRPAASLDALGHYRAHLAPELSEGYVEEARVWRLKPKRLRRAKLQGISTS